MNKIVQNVKNLKENRSELHIRNQNHSDWNLRHACILLLGKLSHCFSYCKTERTFGKPGLKTYSTFSINS